ncbi:MAG: alpha/beta hydrolase [Mycobacteriaceae bacterium]|nr:alpha/beta hydrolase [Mycobacteriaceae bacterium]
MIKRLAGRLHRPRPLLRAVIEVINAVNGLRPLGRKGYKTIAVFWFGWPTSEVPTLYLAASVLDAVRRGRRGDFTGPRGKAALVLQAAAWAVLAVIHRRAVTTPGPVLRTALRDGLGDDYAEVIASLPSHPSRTGRPSGALRTTLIRRRYVERNNVVRYGPHGRANRADVWRKRDLPRDGQAPVLVQIPGGAWMIGMRRPQAYPLMSHLADRGWVCVSVGYRVAPWHTWPDHIVDVKRALAWVKEHIAEYGGDPDFVAITGGSAGGHLASLAALTPNDPAFQPGFEEADTSVVAAVPIYGRYDWYSVDGEGRREFVAFLQNYVVKKSFTKCRQVYVDASSIARVHSDAPPFFVLHGQDDSIIPVQEARDFVRELGDVAKRPVLYAELPHAQHAFDMYGSPRAHQSAEAVAQFLSWVYARRQ